MKKEQIILIRILSVVTALAVMALILIFGPGNGLFQNIVNNMNHNVVDPSSADASIYNLYYYKGLNVVYMILFSISLLSTGLAITSLLTKHRSAYLSAVTACLSMAVTGLFLIFARCMEGNVWLHRVIAHCYLDEVTEQIETARLLPNIPIGAIFMIILSIFGLLMIRSSGMRKIAGYNQKNGIARYSVFFPVLFSSIFIETIREIIMIAVSQQADQAQMQSDTFIRDYYFPGQWGFNWNYAWFLLFMAVSVLLVRFYHKSITGIKGILMIMAVPFILTGIRSLIYYMNPPSLFGYLTMDEQICDITEQLFGIYLIRFCLDVTLITVTMALILLYQNLHKKILIIYAVNAVISIVGILALGHMNNVAGMYLSCIVADVIALVGCFYITNVSRSHH